MIRHFLPYFLATGLLAGIPVFAPSQSEKSAQTETFQVFDGAIPAHTVTRDMVGQDVIVEGTITDFYHSTRSNVPNMLTMAEIGGEAFQAVYWPDTAPLIHGEIGIPTKGLKVSVQGELSDYQGRLQIRIRTPDQIRIEGYPVTRRAPTKAASSSSPNGSGAFPTPGQDGYFTIEQVPAMNPLLNRELSFKGELSEFRAAWNERAPNILYFRDSQSSMEIVFWTPEGMTVPAELQQTGTMIYVTGEFQKYQDRLQLKVDNLDNISTAPLPQSKVVVPGADPERPSSASTAWPRKDSSNSYLKVTKVSLPEGVSMDLRQIGPEHAGNTVTVSGRVESLTATSSERFIVLKDARGNIRVNLDRKIAFPEIGQQLDLVCKVVFNEKRSSAELDFLEVKP